MGSTGTKLKRKIIEGKLTSNSFVVGKRVFTKLRRSFNNCVFCFISSALLSVPAFKILVLRSAIDDSILLLLAPLPVSYTHLTLPTIAKV